MESEAKRRKLGEPPRPPMDATQAMERIEELERLLADRQNEINRLKAEVHFLFHSRSITPFCNLHCTNVVRVCFATRKKTWLFFFFF
jgi:uncharacterized small protein (DUF1192 family)